MTDVNKSEHCVLLIATAKHDSDLYNGWFGLVTGRFVRNYRAHIWANPLQKYPATMSNFHTVWLLPIQPSENHGLTMKAVR